MKRDFKVGVEKSDFEELAIAGHEDFCKEWMNQYPVLFVSFKDVKAEEFADAYDMLGDNGILLTFVKRTEFEVAGKFEKLLNKGTIVQIEAKSQIRNLNLISSLVFMVPIEHLAVVV